MIKRITSFHNPLIKDILLLQKKSHERKTRNLIVVEGIREIRLATSIGFHVQSFLFCPEILPTSETDPIIAQEGQNTDIIETSREVYNKIAYRQDTQGILAVIYAIPLSLSDLKLRNNPLFLVLETVEKPGNLGALLRTADAAGLDAVIICNPQTDIFNPNVIRSSLGCVFTVPIIATNSFEAIDWFHQHGITIYGTALTAKEYYHQSDFTGPSAIIMGSEALGLSPVWFEQCHSLIKIPMRGKIDSLNVSVSAAIVIFEALRQRNFKE
jgi:TrmH family RNA methyltransferase